MLDNSSPCALEPLYRTLQPDAVVQLGSGPITLQGLRSGLEVDASGTIVFGWQPYPSPEVHVQFPDDDGSITRAFHREVHIKVTLPDGTIDGMLSEYKCNTSGESGRTECRARVRLQEVEFQFGDGVVAEVRFHVVNLRDYFGCRIRSTDGSRSWAGRLVLECDDWRVLIDSLDNTNDLIALLNREGGYGITHVGQVTRVDGAPFPAAAAQDALSVVLHLLSFANGQWTPVILPVGMGPTQSHVWRHWGPPKAEPWVAPLTWFNEQRPEGLQEIFCCLLRNWRDDNWRKAVQLALYWYLLAVQNRQPDASIVIAQVGLELLAWVWLVEIENSVNPTTFDKQPASARLRQLLTRAAVPLTIPGTLADLAALAQSEGWVDGPEATTKLRNGAVHPSRRHKTFDAPDDARRDAAELSLWHLELVLLHLLGYNGRYINRLKTKTGFGVEAVPWAPS